MTVLNRASIREENLSGIFIRPKTDWRSSPDHRAQAAKGQTDGSHTGSDTVLQSRDLCDFGSTTWSQTDTSLGAFQWASKIFQKKQKNIKHNTTCNQREQLRIPNLDFGWCVCGGFVLNCINLWNFRTVGSSSWPAIYLTKEAIPNYKLTS